MNNILTLLKIYFPIIEVKGVYEFLQDARKIIFLISLVTIWLHQAY